MKRVDLKAFALFTSKELRREQKETENMCKMPHELNVFQIFLLPLMYMVQRELSMARDELGSRSPG